jgi:hypothetical protein
LLIAPGVRRIGFDGCGTRLQSIRSMASSNVPPCQVMLTRSIVTVAVPVARQADYATGAADIGDGESRRRLEGELRRED